MRNFHEKMIRRSINLKHKRMLPRRIIHWLARALRMGYAIPIFKEAADNYAIEASSSQFFLRQTQRKHKAKKNSINWE
jgi:hypothetical protein